MRIRASKNNMYKLVSDQIGNLPKMKDTDFKSYKGTYWLQYRETRLDHPMKICLDCYAGSCHMIVEDMAEKTSDTIHLDAEELKSRGMVCD